MIHMTIEEAVAILNREKHRGLCWHVAYGEGCEDQAHGWDESPDLAVTFTVFEARSIAGEYERPPVNELTPDERRELASLRKYRDVVEAALV